MFSRDISTGYTLVELIDNDNVIIMQVIQRVTYVIFTRSL